MALSWWGIHRVQQVPSLFSPTPHPFFFSLIFFILNIIVLHCGYSSFFPEVAGSQRLESLFANSKNRVKIYRKKTDMSCYKTMNKDWHPHNSLFFSDTAYCKSPSIFLGDAPDSYSAETFPLLESVGEPQFICRKDLIIQRKR